MIRCNYSSARDCSECELYYCKRDAEVAKKARELGMDYDMDFEYIEEMLNDEIMNRQYLH